MKKLFFILLTLCLCGATWAANGNPDITIEPDESNGLTNTYYFDIVSADDHTVEITYNDTYIYPNAISYKGDITDIPEKITYEGQEYTVIGIGEFAFGNCVEVTSIVIPSFIEYVGHFGIYYIDGLKTAIIESSDTPLRMLNNGYGNTASMFYGCQLTELTVNRNITLEGTDYSTADNYQSLCNGNAYIQKVSIGGAATEICDYAFHNCSKLTEVILSDSITSIGQRAFDQCAMTELTIPASVSSFGDYCFASCASLASIFLLAETLDEGTLSEGATFSAVDFEGDANVTIYVPKGCAATYYASDWESVIVESESLTGFNFNFFSIDIDKTTLEEETSYYYATYYMDDENYEVEIPSTSTLYAVSGIADGEVEMESLTGDIIPMGMPLLIQSSAAGTYYFWKDYYGAAGDQAGYFEKKTKASDTIGESTDNVLYGHSTASYTSANNGTYDPTKVDGYKFYKLSLDSSGSDGSIGFYYGAEGGASYEANANRCWLAIPEAEVTNLSYLSFKKDNGDTTGISSVETNNEANPVKGIYTVQGVRVSNMNQPGLYIVDGRKVLVK